MWIHLQLLRKNQFIIDNLPYLKRKHEKYVRYFHDPFKWYQIGNKNEF